MKQTVGQILKQTRVSKNVTIKDAADATRITSRHLQAMEDDNYGIFPGETYILGFLRSYASYLGLDGDQLIQLYRDHLIEEQEPPLEELTEPAVTYIDYVKKYMYIPVGILFVLGVVAFFSMENNGGHENMNGSGDRMAQDLDTLAKRSQKIPDIETENVKLQAGFATALISVRNGINFSLQNSEAYLVLDNLEFKVIENNLSKAHLYFYPGKKLITLKENQVQLVEEDGVPPFELTLMGATPNTIKIQIQAKNDNRDSTEDTRVSDNIANPSNFIIVLDAITTGENFVEFYIDGRLVKKGLLPAGQPIHFEANDSIQMKIGDAGAINMKINGEPYVFGKRGEQVSKIVRKYKDPLEQTRFKISVKDSP